jgi:hypothetical protein
MDSFPPTALNLSILRDVTLSSTAYFPVFHSVHRNVEVITFTSLLPASAGFVFGLLFDPEYEALCSSEMSVDFHRTTRRYKSRDSVVGIDWLRAGRPRDRSSSTGRVKNFLFSTSSRRALGFIQPRIQLVPGDLSQGVKRPGREADHSSPASAKVKKMWIYTSTLPYAFMV